MTEYRERIDAGDFTRRDFIKGGLAAGGVAGVGMGAFYFGYGKANGSPVRVGVIGTGDEGSVLLGAINPNYVQVVSIADIRPFNQWRAFHGDNANDTIVEVRPGLMRKYGWKTECEAKRHVKIYGPWKDLIDNAKSDGVEGVIIALPLHLHAPVAIYAMQHGLHVLTEKLMGHTVHECKEMARVSENTGYHLATGHQRHYNIRYAEAVDKIKRGMLGDLHYIRAQWHRGNMPGKDSWQMPLPEGSKAKDDKLTEDLVKSYRELKKELDNSGGAGVDALRLKVTQMGKQLEDKILLEKGKDGKLLVESLGYESLDVKDGSGKVVYKRPAIEELIRWRLWDRTGAGLMAELGSHQLDAASIFVAAAHGGEKQIPLSIAAAGNRPLFPPDRDCEDHVYCLLEFPAPGYDPKDPLLSQKKIGMQYASINGNGFGGYGEIVFGTKYAMVIEKEQDLTMIKSGGGEASSVKVAGKGGPSLDTQASGVQAAAAAKSKEKVSRGYTEEIEHWAWCIRHPAPENKPRCHPKVAMGDAIIALTANMAAREGKRIEFKKEWFDIHSDETPENVKPDLNRYKA